MHPRDEEKKVFISKERTFCYMKMPFELKNVGVTYQRPLNIMFKKYIGRNMEVYVNDMMVKTKAIRDHVSNLEEVVFIIRHYEMHLNPKKMCL